MIIFLLRDGTPEPNCEEYDYVVTLAVENTLYNREKILKEIDDYIKSITEYENCVTEYLADYLESRHIAFTIKSFRDMDTIYY